MTAERRLSAVLAGVVAVQAALGLLLPWQYRDLAWITATWFGNDWVTLVVSVPLLVVGLGRSAVDQRPLYGSSGASLIMAPALGFGGMLLWRRHAWGPIVAAMAGIQASLYLLVLSVNSVVAIYRGLAEAPGELPIWGTLAVLTTAATLLLLANVRSVER